MMGTVASDNHFLSGWELLFRPPYGDYILTSERRTILKVLGKYQRGLITSGQSEDLRWNQYRTLLITASRIKEYHINKTPQQFYNLVERHLYNTSVISSRYLKYGIENEALARKAYILRKGLLVKETGMWVNPKYPAIGASPDSLVADFSEENSEGLIEIKQRSRFCCNKEGADLKLKRDHKYYFQIQTQMAVTQRLWCDFVVWTPKDISVLRVQFNSEVFEEIYRNASSFYNHVLIPEYFEQRVPRKLIPFNLA